MPQRCRVGHAATCTCCVGLYVQLTVCCQIQPGILPGCTERAAGFEFTSRHILAEVVRCRFVPVPVQVSCAAPATSFVAVRVPHPARSVVMTWSATAVCGRCRAVVQSGSGSDGFSCRAVRTLRILRCLAGAHVLRGQGDEWGGGGNCGGSSGCGCSCSCAGYNGGNWCRASRYGRPPFRCCIKLEGIFVLLYVWALARRTPVPRPWQRMPYGDGMFGGVGLLHSGGSCSAPVPLPRHVIIRCASLALAQASAAALVCGRGLGHVKAGKSAACARECTWHAATDTVSAQSQACVFPEVAGILRTRTHARTRVRSLCHRRSALRIPRAAAPHCVHDTWRTC